MAVTEGNDNGAPHSSTKTPKNAKWRSLKSVLVEHEFTENPRGPESYGITLFLNFITQPGKS